MGIEKTMRFFARMYAGGRVCRGVLGVVVVAGMVVLGGCGQAGETGSAYYNPTWRSDGKIYAIKESITTYRGSGFIGTSQERSSYLVLMDGDGGNEREIRHLGSELYPRLNASPGGTYLAMGGLGGVEILAVHSGHTTVAQLPVENSFFDWGPDEEKLVFQTPNGVEIYTRDGAKVRDITSLRLVYAWKYSPNLIGDFEENSNIMFRLVDKENVVAFSEIEASIGGGYFPSGDCFFGSVVGAYAKIGMPNFDILETYATLNAELSKEVSVYRVQVNPSDEGEVMYSLGVTSAFPGPGTRQGIILIRLDGSDRQVLRR